MPKFYVTLTWHDWPEGGSYGTVVDAADHDTAEAYARLEMAGAYAEAVSYEDDVVTPEHVLATYSDRWHVVDCWAVQDFLDQHNPPNKEPTT